MKSKFRLWLDTFRASLNNKLFVQLGHGAGGYAMVVTSVMLSHTWLHLLYGWLAVLAWTLPKEYLFDIYVEKQTFADGWIDQRSYLIGGVLASAAALFVLL